MELFEEGRYADARRESLRAVFASPSNETARLLAAVSALRLGREKESARTALQALNGEAESTSIRAMAAYEAGRLAWREDRDEAAFALLQSAFNEARNDDLFLRAGCSLHFMLKEHSGWKKEHPALVQQLQTCRNLWNWDLQKECMLNPPRKGSGLLSKPGAWIVAFYRSQIGPAIGMRCSCEPSCSEYFLRACRKHGLLGFALQADRFYREPSVVANEQNPIPGPRGMRYGDPLSDHDFWWHDE